MEVLEQERRDVLAAHARGRERGQAGAQGGVVQRRVELVPGRQRVGDHQRVPVGAQLRPGAHDLGDLLWRLDPPVEAVPGVGEVEPREGAGPVAEHPDAERLQPLQGGRHVQDGLHPGADDGDGGPAEGGEVGGLVPACARLPVHPAEPAGSEDRDARARGEVGGGGHGGGAPAAARDDGGHVTHAHLDHVVPAGHRAQRLVVQPDADLPGDDRDGRGGGAGVPHGGLHLARDPQVVRPRQPVADDGRLQGDHGSPGVQGGAYVGGDPQAVHARRGYGAARR